MILAGTRQFIFRTFCIDSWIISLVDKREMKIGPTSVASFFLLLCILPFVTGKRHHEQKFCDYLRNVYYSEALGGCKKCDPCFIGWGLVNEINFEIDIEKGALGCRICRPCDEGFFQKRYKAFKTCKACKVCNAPDQIEIRKCTATQNRKCRKNKQDTEENLRPITKEKRKQIPTEKNVISSMAVSSQNRQTSTPETDVPMVPIPVPVRQYLPVKASPSPPKAQSKDNAVIGKETDFKSNKEVFIFVAVLSGVTSFVVLGFIARKTQICLQRRHQQQTAPKEVIETDIGQENTDEGNETERQTENNTQSTDLDTIEMESLLQRRNKSEEQNNREPNTQGVMETGRHEMNIYNRPEGMCSDSENSLPLLPSQFNCDLPPTPEISDFNQTLYMDSGIGDGIHMFSEKMTSRCDTPSSGLDSSDVTNDGNSYCNDDGDDQHLTEAELQAVAYKLAPYDDKPVGRQLGVTDNEIRIIEANHPGNVEERAYEILKKWTEKMAPNTTKKFLKTALIKVQRRDIIQEFYNNSKESQNQ